MEQPPKERKSKYSSMRGNPIRNRILHTDEFKLVAAPELLIQTMAATEISQVYVFVYGTIAVAGAYTTYIAVYGIQFDTELRIGMAILAGFAYFLLGFIYQAVQQERWQTIQVLLCGSSLMWVLISCAHLVFVYHIDLSKHVGVLSALQGGYGVVIYSTIMTICLMYEAVAVHSDHNRPLQENNGSQWKLFSLLLGVACLLFIVARVVVSNRLHVAVDYLPFSNIIDEIQNLRDVPRIPIVLIGVSDLVLVVWCIVQVRETKNAFRGRFIHHIRHKLLGYNFFRFLTTRMTIFYFMYYLLVLFGSSNKTHRGKLGIVSGWTTFTFGVATWLLTTMYGALPVHTRGIKGWTCFQRHIPNTVEDPEQFGSAIKYFTRQADVHLKARYNDLLGDVQKINPTHFVLEQQIEMFNFAYMVYASGHKSYQQDANAFQRLIGASRFKFKKHIYDEQTDTRCFISQSQDKIIVAFKGTSSVKNARTDWNTSKVDHPTAALSFSKNMQQTSTFIPNTISRPNCFKRSTPWVHAGFWRAYSTVSKDVLCALQAMLENADSSETTVCVTGHSLGAALATLCAFDIATLLGHSRVTCTTFGSPRVGGNAFKKLYHQAIPSTFRIVNASDLFTETPMRTLFDSFTEVGSTILIDRSGNLIVDPNVLEYDMIHWGTSTEAHSLTSYQYSFVLWCQNAHGVHFQPHFWPHSLQKLRLKYGDAAIVGKYLKRISIVSPALYDEVCQREHDTQNTVSRLLTELKSNLPIRKSRIHFRNVEHYSGKDAIKYMLTHEIAADSGSAVDFGRILLAKGYISMLGGACAFEERSKFVFT